MRAFPEGGRPEERQVCGPGYASWAGKVLLQKRVKVKGRKR